MKQEKTVRIKTLVRKALKLFGTKKHPKRNIALSRRDLMKKFNIPSNTASLIIKRLWESGQITGLEKSGGGTIYLCCDFNRTKYNAFDLLKSKILDRMHFDSVGDWLETAISREKIRVNDPYLGFVNETAKDKKKIKRIEELVGMPIQFIGILVQAYVDAGLVGCKDGVVRHFAESTRIKKDIKLNYDTLRQIIISNEASEMANRQTTDIKVEGEGVFNEIRSLHQSHDIESIVPTFNVQLQDDSLRIMILPLNIGGQDFDHDVFQKTINQIDQEVSEQNPNVIVIDGLIMGDYPNLQKANRVGLAIRRLDKQIEIGKRVIDHIRKVCPKAKLFVNASINELRFFSDMAVTACKLVQSKSKPLSDDEKQTANYYQVDEVKRSRDYDFHKWFEFYIVRPYTIRCGRKLYSADECEQKFGIRMEEYILLLDAYNAITNDDFENLSLEARNVLELENLPFGSESKVDYQICDDFDLVVKLADGQEKTYYHRHNFSLTGVAQLADALKAPIDVMNQLASVGEKMPDLMTVNDQGQIAGVIRNLPDGRSMVVASQGDFEKGRINRKLYYDYAQNSSRRRKTVRRDINRSGSVSVEFKPDGRIWLHILDPLHLELMDSSPERHAALLCTDVQTGSWTMASDIFALHLSYFFADILPNFKSHLLFGGDMGQCHNYKWFVMENHDLGLVPMDYQQKFNRHIIKKILGKTPKSHLNNLMEVQSIPGNHEWNSAYSWLGLKHLGYIEDLFWDLREDGGFGFALRYPDKVYLEGSGEFMKSFTATTNVAGYNILLQHMIQERGGKGNTARPAMQAKAMAEGLDAYLSPYLFYLSGHWHHFNWFMQGYTMTIVSAALATISNYEWMRGHRSQLGQVVLYLGGGKPPVVELLTPAFYAGYKPKTGYYSDGNLKKLGYVDDPGHNRHECGLFDRLVLKYGRPVIDGGNFKTNPKQVRESAVQKELWNAMDQVRWGAENISVLPAPVIRG